jgi:ComEC/Rec2-related protein
MTGAMLAAAVLAGFAFGWAVVPIIAAVAFLARIGRATGWVLGALIIGAVVLGAIRSAPSRGHELDASWITVSEQTGQIAGSVVDDGRMQRFIVRIDDGHRLCARAFSRADLGRGDRIRLQIDPDATGPISDGYAAYLRSRGCDWSGTAGRITLLRHGTGVLRTFDSVRSDIAMQLVDWVPGNSGALLAGLVVGDDSLMSDETMDAFERTGTLHVVAISGSNLTLLASLLLVASVWSPRRWLTDLAAMAVIWLYVLVGGAGPPTIRAGFLATAGTGARAFGRPPDLMSLSLQVAAIQALIWPSSVLGLSYQLSTVAIFGVLVATTRRSFEGVGGAIWIVVLTTIVVNLVSLPILPAASRPSLLQSLLANTIIAPLVSLAFVLGLLAIAVGVVVPVIGQSIAVVAGEINGATISIVRAIGAWDWLPGSLAWDGSNAPPRLLLAGAIIVMLGVSKDFRRGLRDARVRLAFADEATGMLMLGSGVGACVGVVIVALAR